MLTTIVLVFLLLAGIGAAMSIAADRKMREKNQGGDSAVLIVPEGAQAKDGTISDEMAHTIHALRAPVAKEKWYIDMLLHRGTGKLNAAQKEYLMGMRENNAQLTKVINDLLNSTHAENSSMALHAMMEDLVAVTRETVDANASLIEEYACTVRIQARPAALFLNIDRDAYGEVLSKLLVNAIQYNENKNPIVTISFKKEPTRVALSVSDNGKGISVKESAHIFEKFSRTTKGKKRIPEGSGLGLYVAHRIAEQLGGALTYINSPKQGSTFTLSLPIEGTAPRKGARSLAR